MSGKIEKKDENPDAPPKKEENKKEEKSKPNLKASTASNGSAKSRSSDPAEGIMPVVADEPKKEKIDDGGKTKFKIDAE